MGMHCGSGNMDKCQPVQTDWMQWNVLVLHPLPRIVYYCLPKVFWPLWNTPTLQTLKHTSTANIVCQSRQLDTNFLALALTKGRFGTPTGQQHRPSSIILLPRGDQHWHYSLHNGRSSSSSRTVHHMHKGAVALTLQTLPQHTVTIVVEAPALHTVVAVNPAG